MNYFVIGNYHNEQGQQYSTVVFQCEASNYSEAEIKASEKRKQMNEEILVFFATEFSHFISFEELTELRENSGLYNQIDIVTERDGIHI
jgi:peptide methionine sulfoxide reductase MsrA